MIDQLDGRIRDALAISLADAPSAPSASEVARFMETATTVQISSAETRRPLRTFVAAGFAAAAVIVGLLVIVSNRPAAEPSASMSPVTGWAPMADPTGVFVVEPGLAEFTTPDGTRMTANNGISVYDLESTTHGLVAVGVEQDGFARTAAAWLSPDGATWRRAPDDGELGTLTDRDDPNAPTSELLDVAEFGGRLIAVGSTQPRGTAGAATGAPVEPAAWRSNDGITWERLDLPEPPSSTVGPGSWFVSITATSTGWAAVLSNPQFHVSGPASGTVEVWTTTTGDDWSRSTPDAGDLMVESIAAIPAGLIIGGTDASGLPTVWTSTDGTTWRRTRLATDGIGTLTRIVRLGDTAIALSSAMSSSGGVGHSPADDADGFELLGSSELRIWSSTDGLTWQQAAIPDDLDAPQQWVASAAADADGAVIAVRTMDVDGPAAWTLSSGDGRTWTATPTATPGMITALAATDSTWIAASTGGLDILGPRDDGTSDSRNTVILTATTN